MTNILLYITMYNRGKFMLMFFLLAGVILSCSKKEFTESGIAGSDIAESDIEASASVSMVLKSNIIYEETFEGSSYFPIAGNTVNQIHNIENCGTAWTLSRVSNPVYRGSKASRFEIRKGQPRVGSAKRVRSEVTIFRPQEDAKFANQPDLWYSFSLFLPSRGMEDDPKSKENLCQWFEDGGDDCTIKVRNGRMYFTWIDDFYDLFGTANAASTKSVSTVGSAFKHVSLDSWHNFIFHFVHSKGSDGLVEIWRDGVKIQTLKGPNMHTSILPKWKVGLYKSDYTEASNRSIRSTRIVYFDNIMVGKKGSTVDEMSSSGSTHGNDDNTDDNSDDGSNNHTNKPPTVNAGSNITITLPVNKVLLSGRAKDLDGSIRYVKWTKVNGPSQYTFSSTNIVNPAIRNLKAGVYTFRLTVTDNEGLIAKDDITVTVKGSNTKIPGPIKNFTLINSVTEKGILTMVNGGVYSLKQLPGTKLNIRANTGGNTVRVKFELNGVQNKTTLDKAAPFALMQDDGDGNYWYGNWNPPKIGKYTLKATPYYGANDDWVAGPTAVIHFTIKK